MLSVFIIFDFRIGTLLLIKDILKGDKLLFVNEHDVFDLHDGVRYLEFSSLPVLLEQFLEINYFLFFGSLLYEGLLRGEILNNWRSISS